MRRYEEINKAIENIKKMFTPENITEFYRGQISAFMWALEKNSEEIKEAIENIKKMFTPENITEFYRGQISAFMWILEQ